MPKVKVYVVPENDTKRAKTKAWFKNRMVDMSCWWDENKDVVSVVAPVVIGGLTVGAKVIGKYVNLGKEQALKDRYVYDTSLGHYWELRKKLTNAEWTEIERRRNAGEKLGSILENMKVLK